MPLWEIYHPDNVFTSQEEKDALAAAITASYDRIPAFYVVVVFITLPGGSIYRSGKSLAQQNNKPFVRLVVHHLARHASDYDGDQEAGAERMRLVVDRAIKEHIVDKGYAWESTISEDDRRYWKIDGLMPPPYGSEAMQRWKEEDKASPY